MPQTTLQHSGCSVVSTVKTKRRPPPSRLPPAKPPHRLRSVPFRLSGSVSLLLAPCHSAFHSAPPYPFPPHPAPPAHSLPRTFPPPLPVPSRSARLNPLLPRSLPFRHSPGYAHRNYSSKKQKKCADFFCFSFPRPIFVLQIRLFYSIPTHSLPTGLTNTQ